MPQLYNSLPQRTRKAVVVLVSVGLLFVLGFSLKSLFSSRTSQSIQNTSQPQAQAPRQASTPIEAVSSVTNWATFRSQEQGYLIKYPRTFFYKLWDVSEDPLRIQYVSFIPKKYRDTYQAPEVGVVVYKNAAELSLKEWLTGHTEQTPNAATASSIFESIRDLQEVRLAGVPALKFIEESPSWNTSAPTILLSVENKMFRLFYTNAYSNEDLQETFGFMVDTFQLLQK